MTTDSPRPPAVPPGHWVECPLCHEFFRNEQARGSHLHYVHRQSSTRKVRPRFETPPQGAAKTLEAVSETPKSLANATPTPSAPRSAPQPLPDAPPQPPEPPARSAPVPAAPEPVLPPKAPVSEASPTPQAAAPAVKPVSTSSPNGGVWTALGIGVGSLTALILANKGKNAPRPAPTTAAELARPPATLPDGIWTTPEPLRASGIPYVDRMLGYSGVPKPRRRLF